MIIFVVLLVSLLGWLFKNKLWHRTQQPNHNIYIIIIYFVKVYICNRNLHIHICGLELSYKTPITIATYLLYLYHVIGYLNCPYLTHKNTLCAKEWRIQVSQPVSHLVIQFFFSFIYSWPHVHYNFKLYSICTQRYIYYHGRHHHHRQLQLQV